MSKITVALSGLFFPMAILRYFEAALRRRKDVELLTVGPYTGNWIPWNGGMTLPMKYAIPPTIPLPSNARYAPIDYVEKQFPQKIDLWVQIDAGFHLDGRPTNGNGKNVIVGTDPHVLPYDEQRELADTFYCMQAHYAKSNDEYLPYAYDPIWHAPQDEERLFDVCLCGLHYEPRNRLVEALRNLGVKVYYDLGPSFDEARKLYNQAPIGINWSSRKDLTARVFELLGMRRLAVVNHVPDLPKFFEDGKDLIAFNNDVAEAAEKIMYHLQNEDESETIAQQGYKTVAPHTWDARIEQILGNI